MQAAASSQVAPCTQPGPGTWMLLMGGRSAHSHSTHSMLCGRHAECGLCWAAAWGLLCAHQQPLAQPGVTGSSGVSLPACWTVYQHCARCLSSSSSCTATGRSSAARCICHSSSVQQAVKLVCHPYTAVLWVWLQQHKKPHECGWRSGSAAAACAGSSTVLQLLPSTAATSSSSWNAAYSGKQQQPCQTGHCSSY